jgi:SAM-dependent methyltransferase
MNEPASLSSTTGLDFSGERYVPGVPGEIAYEHWHRYAFASLYAAGKTVLDVASGEGYGAHLLARTARAVHAADIAQEAVSHARESYAEENLHFACASCAALPYPDASFDLVVSFETIEHVDAAAQKAMLAEFRRVLKRDGCLLISSPNRAQYSDARGYRNEFHVHELYREEFQGLLAAEFPCSRWLRQRLQFWSGIWSEGPGLGVATQALAGGNLAPYRYPQAMYFLVLAAGEERFLPEPPRLSLFTDEEEAVFAQYEEASREVLRLDGLLAQRDHELGAASQTIAKMEALIAERESLIAEREHHVEERDRWLEERAQRLAFVEGLVAQRDAEIVRLNELVSERERLVAERDGWLKERLERIAFVEGLVAERDAALATLSQEIAHLAELESGRAATVEERERDLAAQLETLHAAEARIAGQDAELVRQHALLEERERIILHRQRWKWWLALPWFRFKLWRGGR